MAVSIATLGFSFPAHNMPKLGWGGAVPSLVGEESLPPSPATAIATLLGPIQTSGEGLGHLDPQRLLNLTPWMTGPPGAEDSLRDLSVDRDLVQRELGKKKRGRERGQDCPHLTPTLGEYCP